jgi:hypothetical protein
MVYSLFLQITKKCIKYSKFKKIEIAICLVANANTQSSK